MKYIYGQSDAWNPIIDRMLPFLNRKALEMDGNIQFERVDDRIVALCTDSKYLLIHRSRLDFDAENVPDGERIVVPKKALKNLEPWGSGLALPMKDRVIDYICATDYVDKYEVNTSRMLWVDRQVLLDMLKLARPFFSAEIGISCMAEDNQLSMGIGKHVFIGSERCPVQFQAEIPCRYDGEFAFSVRGEHLYQYIKNSPNRDVSFCISSEPRANMVEVDYHIDSEWRFVLCPFIGFTWTTEEAA